MSLFMMHIFCASLFFCMIFAQNNKKLVFIDVFLILFNTLSYLFPFLYNPHRHELGRFYRVLFVFGNLIKFLKPVVNH